ncbi:MAG: alpha/beta hydrolase-fold protein [Aquaticitalea sp.]
MQLRHYLFIFLCVLSFRISAQSTASQQVDNFNMQAIQLSTTKKIWVYLPKDYENSQKAYSVIYMHDAQNLFDAKTSYVGEWEVDEYLDSICKNEAIVIGVEHGNEKRIDELTPYKNANYGGGKGDAYLDFIINTIKPHVDSTYRTITDAKHTTIFGSSLGGLISFYAIIRHPDIFGNAGIFSPSFWINPEIYPLVEMTDIPKSSRFYFAIGSEEGDEDMVPDQEKMVALLKRKGVKPENIVNKIIIGGKHNETFWSDYFPEAYQWLVKN